MLTKSFQPCDLTAVASGEKAAQPTKGWDLETPAIHSTTLPYSPLDNSARIYKFVSQQKSQLKKCAALQIFTSINTTSTHFFSWSLHKTSRLPSTIMPLGFFGSKSSTTATGYHCFAQFICPFFSSFSLSKVCGGASVDTACVLHLRLLSEPSCKPKPLLNPPVSSSSAPCSGCWRLKPGLCTNGPLKQHDSLQLCPRCRPPFRTFFWPAFRLFAVIAERESRPVALVTHSFLRERGKGDRKRLSELPKRKEFI